MLAAQYVAFLRPSELCSFTTGQVTRPLWGSGTRCWAPLFGSTGGSESLENRRIRREHLVGRRTLGCTQQSAGEIQRRQGGCNTPLKPITGHHDFAKMGRNLRSERDHHSSVLSSARRGRHLDKDSKTRQMAQRQKRQEARETRSSAEGNIEIVPRHEKVWTALVVQICVEFSTLRKDDAKMVDSSYFWV